MKYFLSISCMCFHLLASCQNHDKVKALENENRWIKEELEAVKEELRACREGQPIFPEDFFLDNFASLDKTEQLDFDDLNKITKVVVKSFNGKDSITAASIETATNIALEAIERLHIRLTKALCGEDCDELQKEHFRDKATATKVMLDEGEAKKLREELESLLAFYAGFQIKSEDLKIYQPLHLKLADGKSWETTGKTWEEFKFRGMPPAAIFPILSQMKVHIRHDELKVLETLKK